MCGICGYIQPTSLGPIDSSHISTMCQTLIHRGPDDEGTYCSNSIAMGTRRLSIIDVEGGHQPLGNEDDSIWVAHNGEIYNFPQIRKELIQKGHRFRTQTDTETIVHSYEEWAEEFIPHFHGMFAFALFDGRAKQLFLVRDRIGIKPLYYTLLENSTLVFGSELKALIAHPEVRGEVEPRALDLFLTLEYIPAPYSIFKNIHKLPPGCFLRYKEGKIHIQTYWSLEASGLETKNLKMPDLRPVMDECYELLKESVKERMISDVPLGAFLSGGIDSSSIVGLMRDLGVSPLRTFSIGFEDSTYNELEQARRIARKFDTEHEEMILRPKALDLTEKLIFHLDEPFGDFSIFPTYLVSRMAREHVKVTLSGDGGDELFGGYEHYQAQKLSNVAFLDVFPRASKPFVNLFPPSSKKKGLWNKIQRFCQGYENEPQMRHMRWMMFLSTSAKHSLYTPALQESLGGIRSLFELDPLHSLLNNLPSEDSLNNELFLDLKTYLADDILVKVDRMSMATSLETRVPFLDHRIVEFIFRIPSKYKLKGMTTKWILKKTMERLLPHENIYRSKEGFSIPIKHWLKTDLKDLMLDYLKEERINEEGLFQFPAIRKMIDQHLSQRRNFSHQLWALLVFEIWKDRYL